MDFVTELITQLTSLQKQSAWFILGLLYIVYLFFALRVHRADRERLTQLAIKGKLLLRFDYGWSGVRMVLDARPPSPPCKENKEKEEETGAKSSE